MYHIYGHYCVCCIQTSGMISFGPVQHLFTFFVLTMIRSQNHDLDFSHFCMVQKSLCFPFTFEQNRRGAASYLCNLTYVQRNQIT